MLPEIMLRPPAFDPLPMVLFCAPLTIVTPAALLSNTGSSRGVQADVVADKIAVCTLLEHGNALADFPR